MELISLCNPHIDAVTQKAYENAPIYMSCTLRINTDLRPVMTYKPIKEWNRTGSDIWYLAPAININRKTSKVESISFQVWNQIDDCLGVSDGIPIKHAITPVLKALAIEALNNACINGERYISPMLDRFIEKTIEWLEQK